MSPILVRPVREQLEHDRVIRLLQVRLKRRHDVVANIGEDQTVPVRIGQVQIFPDLVLTSTDRGHKLMGTVEVETAESVNHLEAMAQWAHLGRARAPFHLYVPAGSVDIARRLAAENHVNVAEIWSYHTIGDQTRFTPVYRAPAARHAARGRRKPPRRHRSAAASGARPAPPRPLPAAPAKAPPAPPPPSRPKPAGARRAPHVRRGASRPRARPQRAPRRGSRGSNPAVPQVQPRQAWLREHVRRPHRPAPREVPLPDPLLVPDAARCARRTVRARRRCHPPDRTAQSRRRVRLDAHSEGTGCAPGAEAGRPAGTPDRDPAPRELSPPPPRHFRVAGLRLPDCRLHRQSRTDLAVESRASG